MKKFFASAQHLDDPGRQLAAFVVARDRNEAVMALRRHQAGAGYAMFPAELALLED